MITHFEPVTYSFDFCTIDTAKREVCLRGVVQRTGPRTLALLLYLIQHRDRVVTREELLTHVWGGSFLSASAIARAVMKARHAVGDFAEEPTLIRTIHRVGYRFVAPVAVGGGSSAARAAAAPPSTAHLEAPAAVDSRKLRLAVLPFSNLTGDRSLAWIELGLMSLVNQALEADDRLHVAPVVSVLGALQAQATDEIDDVSKVRVLSRLMGVQYACGVTVSRTDRGVAFDYRLATVGGIVQTGTMEGSDPTTLCQQLIRHLEADLLEGEVGALRLQSDDPWVNQAFARAMQAFQVKNGQSALRLVRVVLELEPDNRVVRHGLLAILCQLGEPEASALGEALLQEALDLGEYRRAAYVHCLLAMARHLQGESSAARRHSEESVRLAGPINSSYRTQYIYNEAASAAYRRGEHDRARDLYRQVELASEATGNDVQRLIAVADCASIDAVRGDVMKASELWEACLPQFEALNQRSRVMLLRCNLSLVSECKGRLDLAVQHADALVVMLPQSQIRWFNLQCLSTVCTTYAQARRLDKVEHAMAAGGLPSEDLTVGELIHAGVADAQRDFCRYDFEGAAVKLHGLVAQAVDRNDIEHASIWAPLLIHGEMRAGRYVDAEATATALMQMPTLDGSPDLPGMRLHARALDLHARGRRAAARKSLGKALEVMKPSRWSMLIRLDSAWLDIESGDLDAAKHVLAGTLSWLQTHPIGRFVDARLQFALGEREMAIAAMKGCISFFQPESAEWMLQSLVNDKDVPTAVRLPSMI